MPPSATRLASTMVERLWPARRHCSATCSRPQLLHARVQSSSPPPVIARLGRPIIFTAPAGSGSPPGLPPPAAGLPPHRHSKHLPHRDQPLSSICRLRPVPPSTASGPFCPRPRAVRSASLSESPPGRLVLGLMHPRLAAPPPVGRRCNRGSASSCPVPPSALRQAFVPDALFYLAGLLCCSPPHGEPPLCAPDDCSAACSLLYEDHC